MTYTTYIRQLHLKSNFILVWLLTLSSLFFPIKETNSINIVSKKQQKLRQAANKFQGKCFLLENKVNKGFGQL